MNDLSGTTVGSFDAAGAAIGSPSVAEIRHQTDCFLTETMADSLRGVDHDPLEPGGLIVPMAEVARGRVRVAHALGSPEARYTIDAFGQRLHMQVQLNVYRLVIVYTIPQLGSLDSEVLRSRFARWEAGANHAGWHIGWRDAIDMEIAGRRCTEIYCYAMLPLNFLESERHQLYWVNDTVQMTRAFFLEARRIDVKLSD